MVKTRKQRLKPLVKQVLLRVPGLRAIVETLGTGCPANHKYFFFQKILGFNRSVPWPVHFTSIVSGAEHIQVGVNTAPGASIANYIFASVEAPIYVGDYTVVASNVCIGTYNHDVYDIRRYTHKGPIHIGRYCWIGANAVVLSGVTLGDHTVVAAGAVVDRSFPDGCCILAGNPARVVKRLEPTRVVAFTSPYLYRGWHRLGPSSARSD